MRVEGWGPGGMGQRAEKAGEHLRRALTDRLSKYEMVAEVRGLGLLNGIEFRPPRSHALRIPFLAFAHVHPAMFGQMLVMRLFRDHDILSQICGNNFLVLKAAPGGIVTEDQGRRILNSRNCPGMAGGLAGFSVNASM